MKSTQAGQQVVMSGKVSSLCRSTLFQFGGFFHHGHISAKRSVENGFETQAAQEGVELFGEVLAA